MKRSLRQGLIVGIVLAAVVIVAGLTGFYLLQTSWFFDQVRHRIVAGVEKATGGKVEVRSFAFNWHTMSAELQGFTLHGTEPVGSPPLFSAQSIYVQLKLLSILKRSLDLTTVRVQRPTLYILIRPDGTTNLPKPKVRRAKGRSLSEQLIDLKIKHFEWNDGVVQTDIERVPLSVHGTEVAALVTYDALDLRYQFHVTSHETQVRSRVTLPAEGDVTAEGTLETHRLVVNKFAYATATSHINGDLLLNNFLRPALEVHLSGMLAAAEIGRLTRFAQLRGGEVAVTGIVHYDAKTPLNFEGQIRGRRLVYESRSLSLRSFSMGADVMADPERVWLQHVSAAALGSTIEGRGSINGYRELALRGEIRGLQIREAAKLLSDRPLPWSGVASGPFRIDGSLGQQSNWVVESQAHIAASQEAMPVSGDIDASYRQRENTLELRSASVQFPHSVLSASGVPGKSLTVKLDTTNLSDLNPAIAWASPKSGLTPLAGTLQAGSGHFSGIVSGPLGEPYLDGDLSATHVQMQGVVWDELKSHISVARNGLDFKSASLRSSILQAAGSGHFGLKNWMLDTGGLLRLQGQFQRADLAALAERFSSLKLPIIRGQGSGTADLRGTVNDPSGSARISIDSLDAYGERLNQVQMTGTFTNNAVQVTQGKLQAGPAVIAFAGAYHHANANWLDGTADLKVDTNGFPLASLSTIRRYEPGVNGQFEIHSQSTARIVHGALQPQSIEGNAAWRDVSINGFHYGSVSASAVTHNGTIETKIAANVRGTPIGGTLRVEIAKDYLARGEFRVAKTNVASLAFLLGDLGTKPLPGNALIEGDVSFDGPLLNWKAMHGKVQLEQVELTSVLPEAIAQPGSTNIVLKNSNPIVIEARDGVATVKSFEVTGKDTQLTLSGTMPYLGSEPINLKAAGTLNLQIFQMMDANVTAGGRSDLSATIGGTLRDPSVNGTMEIHNASFFLANVPNGLSGVNGTVRFDRNRATIQKLSAHSGGGDLALSGFVSFGGNGPLVYQLVARATDVRVRYAGGVSITANADLHFTGTSENSLAAGSITVTKAAFNPSTDVGALLAGSAAPVPSPSNQKGFLQGVQFDIRAESAPNLQLSTSLSQDVEAEIDLHVRGTPEHPAVLGRISVNQGNIRVFGTKYTINRGGVNFYNPAKIEPVLDLDLQTEARGINVDITVSGTLAKLNINYRSDPPLQSREIIALLAVGRTPGSSTSVANQQVTNDSSALQSGTNTVLGQAISPVSNRLSRLFGITNIKIDPLVQGITNTPQARLTLEQQISKQITVTYITNLSQTSEQIFRLEWAINRQYSLIALRDDNGEFGIDIQFKRRFK